MVNKIILIGRITKDLELKQAGQTTMCNFSIAVNRRFAKDGQQKADFINCVVFGKQADNLVKYQNKGSLIAVCGELNIDQYEKDGEKKTFTKVLANEISYLGTSKDNNDTGNKFESVEIDDSDIPF